jgi:beta-lactamase regulating signal transducer with metallopeptidase domain
VIDYSSVAPFVVGTAINLMVVGTVIAMTAAVVLRLTSGTPPRLRYLFTLTAFVCAAALPFVLALTQSQQTEFQPAASVARAENLSIPNGLTYRSGAAGDVQARRFETERKRVGVESGITAWRFLISVLYRPSISMSILSLWILGACLLFIREVVAHLGVAHARRKFIKADPKLLHRLVWPQNVGLYVDDYCGPCALGITNSIIVIPAKLCVELPQEALGQIARHELDHLKWRDPLVNAAMRLVLALLWPSAPLWYLNRKAKLEREAAADRAALDVKGNEPRKDTAAADYASALVVIGRKYAGKNGSQPSALVATEMGDERGLNERVRRLLTTPSPPTALRTIITTGTLLAAVSLINVLPVASVRSKANKLDRAVANLPVELPDVRTLMDARHDGLKEVSTVAVSSPVQRRLPDLTAPPIQSPLNESERSNKAAASNANVEVRPSSTPSDISNDFEHQMAALGYRNLTPDQIARMHQYAVGPAYVRELAEFGYTGLDAETLITLKWLAVSGSYIEEMKSLGYERLTPILLAHFRRHGVSSQYIKEMRSRLAGHITAEQLASLRLYGASTNFLDELKSLGYENLNADQVISMRLQGVTIAYIEQMQARLMKHISADELISMRMRNIY